MAQDENHRNRLVTRGMWARTAVLVVLGGALLWVGPVWLGLTVLAVTPFGLAPLVVEDCRRRRGDRPH